MVGLHDAAHIMRQINAIQLSLEEQDEQMVAYWTEIRKDEKEVTLLAGRVSANETSIGQLQVTAQQLTASVSSLTTTVNGHTTSIGQLEITANSVSQRVTVIEGDYVKEAEISLMVKKDSSGYISNALIKADDIDFVFTRAVSWYWQSKAEANKRMGLDSNGDLWIKGDLKGGNIQGNYTIGSLGSKMEIYVDEAVGATKCSGIRGRDSNNNEVINLGMQEVEGNIRASLTLNNPNDNNRAILVPNGLSINSGGNGFTIGLVGTVLIYAPINLWPTYTALVGQVYLDNGYLKVKTL
jgi:hypothetical protein